MANLGGDGHRKNLLNRGGPAMPVTARRELMAPMKFVLERRITWRDISDCMAEQRFPKREGRNDGQG